MAKKTKPPNPITGLENGLDGWHNEQGIAVEGRG